MHKTQDTTKKPDSFTASLGGDPRATDPWSGRADMKDPRIHGGTGKESAWTTVLHNRDMDGSPPEAGMTWVLVRSASPPVVAGWL